MDTKFLAFGFLEYVVFLFSTTCHEASHALAAKWGGDTTASEGGQVSLNQKSEGCVRGPMCCQDDRIKTWGSGHPGGAVLVMADASTTFVTDSINPLVMAAISTRNKADAIPEGF